MKVHGLLSSNLTTPIQPLQSSNMKEVTGLFTDKFPNIDAPHRDTVRKLVNRFRETGSVLDRKPQRTRHVLTEEKLDEIGETFQLSLVPKHSAAAC
ncbi:hypothetical protein C0J52_13809 [Blattella germanica]|nr:hypothetical protein C0J52_13809 [Blattella germanica]